MNDVTRRAITIAVTLLILGWLKTWMGKTRLRPMGAEEAGVLRHPASTLVVGMVATGSMLFLSIATFLAMNRTNFFPSLLFLGLAVASALLVVEYQRARHELIPGGMRYGKLFGKPGQLSWTGVERLAYSPSMKWFRIELASGATVRVSVMLTSLPAFAKSALAGVAPGKIDEKTLHVLRSTADGSPPSIWNA